VKRGWRGSLGLGSGREGGLGGGGSGGCVVVVEFCVEGLHLFHVDVVCSAELQFIHCEGVGFESECHTLQYYLLVKVWLRKAALLKPSMKVRNVSSWSCLTPRREKVVV